MQFGAPFVKKEFFREYVSMSIDFFCNFVTEST